MQYNELMQLLNEGSDGGASVLDPFAGIREILPIVLVWSFVIVSIIAVLWVISIIGRVRAERAMVNMQKDMKAVRELLEQNLSTTPAPIPTPAQPQSEQQAESISA